MKKGKRVVALFLTAAMVFGVCDWVPMGRALAEFTLPRAMKEIREEAFFKNENITGTISTGETKKIKERAFFESGLFGVRIEESAQYIGEDAFVTPYIAYAYIEGKNTEIEEGAFDGAVYIFGHEDSAAKRWYDGSYTNAEFIPIDKIAEDENFFYLINEEEQTAQVLLPVNPERSGSSVTIPDEINGKKVTEISETGFLGLSSVTKVIVPKGMVLSESLKRQLAQTAIIVESNPDAIFTGSFTQNRVSIGVEDLDEYGDYSPDFTVDTNSFLSGGAYVSVGINLYQLINGIRYAIAGSVALGSTWDGIRSSLKDKDEVHTAFGLECKQGAEYELELWASLESKPIDDDYNAFNSDYEVLDTMIVEVAFSGDQDDDSEFGNLNGSAFDGHFKTNSVTISLSESYLPSFVLESVSTANPDDKGINYDILVYETKNGRRVGACLLDTCGTHNNPQYEQGKWTIDTSTSFADYYYWFLTINDLERDNRLPAGTYQIILRASFLEEDYSISGSEFIDKMNLTIVDDETSNSSSVIFTMTPNPAVVGSEVTFELNAQQIEKVRLVVDKVRYEEIELTDGKATYNRVINKAGNRKVTFEPWVNGAWGKAAKVQTLLVTANDILDEPGLTLDGGNGKIGEDYSFGLDPVEHADNYHIRVYQPITGALVYYDVISASELAAASNRVTVSGTYLQKDGEYSLSVIAVGYGYSQRESTGSFIVGASDYSVEVLTPHEGDEFKAGDTFHMSLQQSGSGYVQLRVEGPAPALYPQEEPYRTSEKTYRADMPVTVAGDYTISAVVFASEDSSTPAAEPHSIHVHVKGPGIVSTQVGQNGANYTWVEPGVDQMKVFIAANDAVDRVTVSEGGVINTASYDAAIGKYVADLPSSVAGKHTITILAYDDDIVTGGVAASTSSSRTFYLAVKLDTPVIVYPDAETVTLSTSPINGSGNAVMQGGAWFEPLVKTHEAGDWVKVQTIDGESEGFVERSKISDTLPSGASGAIEILSPAENGKLQTGTQTMTVNWHAGLALSDSPKVDWTITGLDSSASRSQSSQGFGTAALNVSGLDEGLYELSASVSDIGGQTYTCARRFQIGEMTKEEKYREWFNKKIVPSWWFYDMYFGITASQHYVKWEMDKLENILIGGYLYQGSWILPWKNFKEGLHHNSTVYDAETELARDRLIFVANSVKKDEEKGKLTLAKDYSNMNALVREKQNTALTEKRFDVVFDFIAAAIASAKSGMDIAVFAGGMSAEEAKEIADGVLDLTDTVTGALEIVVKDWVEKYDAEVLLAAYIDEYKAALEETCDDYVAHLEKAYFGGMDVEEYKKINGLSDSQAAAAKYINAFKAYRAQVAAIPGGATYLQSQDHYAYNEGVQHAIADLLEFSGLEFGNMSDFDSYSANMLDALWEAMPGICLKLVDYFAERMADELLKTLNDKDFIKDNPTLGSIPVQDLEKATLKSCFKKLLKLKAEKDKNTGKYSWEFVIDTDAALKSLQDTLQQWCTTLGPELIAQIFIHSLLDKFTTEQLKNLQPTLITYAEKNYQYSRIVHTYGDLEPGMAKAVHGAIKNAWNTGTKIAKLLDDIDMAASIENGLPALVSYAGLFYAGMEEQDDLVRKYQEAGGIEINSSSQYLKHGSEMLDGNSVQEMERLRSVLISFSNFEWENMNNFQNMRTVLEKNESWYFTTDYEENGFIRYFDRPDYQYGLLSFPTDDFIEATKDEVNDYKAVFMNVPDELKEYVESIQ